MSWLDELAAELKADEGLRRIPYRDTVGVLTVGYGRNLDAVGIAPDEAELMLKNDISAALGGCEALPFWDEMPDPAKRALANMAFNLGRTRFLRFRKMLVCLAAGDFDGAAREALDSVWARQVQKSRVERIVALLRAAGAERAAAIAALKARVEADSPAEAKPSAKAGP
jgi:lysozyme